MKIDSFILKAPHKQMSEDDLVVNHKSNLFGVFDGATPITPFFDENGKNGAVLASELFKDYFLNKFNPHLTLNEGIIEANELLRNTMINHGVNQENYEDLWTTCVALVKFEPNGSLSFAQLGDCMVLVKYRNGDIQILTKDTVKDISYRAKAWREEKRKQGISFPKEEHYKDLNNQLIFNRYLANKKNGYTVANGKKAVANYIQSGTLKLDSIEAILLISDGLFHPKTSLVEVFNRVIKTGVKSYCRDLEELEFEMNLHSDDKSGLLIQF